MAKAKRFRKGDRVVFYLDPKGEAVTVVKSRDGARYTQIITNDGVEISYRTDWLWLSLEGTS